MFSNTAVAEVAEELADLADAFFVVFDFGVDFQAAAGLQHERLFHRRIIAPGAIRASPIVCAGNAWRSRTSTGAVLCESPIQTRRGDGVPP